MSKTNSIVFIILLVISWLIFAGLGIEAGGLLVNFFFSLYKPEFLPNLYQKLDLTDLYKSSAMAFYIVYAFIISIAVLKTVLFYIVVRLMHKMDLRKPFDSFVARHILLMSYFTIAIGLLSLIARKTTDSLIQQGFTANNLNFFWVDSQAFILMGAVIYIIATIFKKGVDLQNENDLTV